MPVKIPYTFKKMMITLTVVSMLAIPVGCSKASNDQSQAPSATPISNTPIKEQEDQDLTKKLTSENVVQGGKVYLAGNEAIATIIIKKGTVEKTIKDLATKYANTMKQKYSNKKIHVVAFMENIEVANVSL
jgi:selenocysteine-specific translation elongation factor